MLSFAIIVNKFLGLAASQPWQVTDFLGRGHVDIPCHGFKRCFRGCESLPLKLLSCKSRNYLLIY